MGEPELKRMTADEFLLWQRSQDRNYELVDGFPVLPLKAMTGASRAHDRIVVRILAQLLRQLEGGRCEPTTDDIAVRTPAGDIRRPDVTVECGGRDPKGSTAMEPRLVVEVLSPSTMNYDRVRKLDESRTIPSLAYILLVDTEKPQLTLYAREDADWLPHHFVGLDAVVDLPAIGCRLEACECFKGLPFAD